MLLSQDILTVSDVALELRCSKTHVHNAIKGKVAGVSQLPAIHMGRRKLIRRSALEQWKTANERNSLNDVMPKLSKVDAA
jgi:excisionase family DNA binding protein